VVGRPGSGKSFATLDMAAHVSTGTSWPDGSACPRGSVLLISAEDDPSDTIRPRLDAGNADANKIHLVSAVRHSGRKSERMVTLADLDVLEAALRQLGDCLLMIVDPVGSFLGGGVDAHRDNEVRGVLAPLAQLAERFGSAVVVVAHRRKAIGPVADDLALGSRAFVGIARSVLHVTPDPNNKSRRLLLPGKCNLAAARDGLAFSIGGDPPRVTWELQPVTMTADDVLAIETRQAARPGPKPVARDAAADWLLGLLKAGPAQTAAVKAEAAKAGYPWRTVQRAADQLGVQRVRQRVGQPGLWQLPASSCQDDPEERGNMASWHNGDKPENAGFHVCAAPVWQEGDNVASWHNGERPGKNADSEPGATPPCQDRAFWHDGQDRVEDDAHDHDADEEEVTI
jgi:hypothetical protein